VGNSERVSHDGFEWPQMRDRDRISWRRKAMRSALAGLKGGLRAGKSEKSQGFFEHRYTGEHRRGEQAGRRDRKGARKCQGRHAAREQENRRFVPTRAIGKICSCFGWCTTGLPGSGPEVSAGPHDAGAAREDGMVQRAEDQTTFTGQKSTNGRTYPHKIAPVDLPPDAVNHLETDISVE